MPGAQLTFEAIGTTWNIEVFDDISESAATKLKQKILARIDIYDKNYSRFRDDSLVTLIATEPGRYTLPDDAKPLLDLYEQLYKSTGGIVTPLIGQTLSDAGYDAQYSLKPGKVSAPPRWKDAMDYDFPHLTTRQPVLLDFGAAGKGYLVDIISNMLRHDGIKNYCVDAGGDMVYRTTSSKPLQIGLEHPLDSSMAVGVAKIHNQSLCGSAGNRRAWGRYTHIISPNSLASPTDIAAVWVTADSGLVADGIATALFFVSAAKIRPAFRFEYAIIRSDMSLQHSVAFPAQFFTEQANKD
jgi:thiamine biosynthesis lipoprotein